MTPSVNSTEQVSNSQLAALLETKCVPDQPGVYLFRNASNRIVYVGKARSLLRRLRSYVRAPADGRHRALASETRDFDFIATNSEVDALILEEHLVKLHRPRYNVKLKDDKKFPYLKLTVNDPYPSLTVTRVLTPDGAEFYGPYTNVKALRRAVRVARCVFRLRSCTSPFASGSHPKKVQMPSPVTSNARVGITEPRTG
ncbi:MAG: GIY-YIG nuclease family protein, partial [candidate division WOR-3 bacterium]